MMFWPQEMGWMVPNQDFFHVCLTPEAVWWSCYFRWDLRPQQSLRKHLLNRMNILVGMRDFRNQAAQRYCLMFNAWCSNYIGSFFWKLVLNRFPARSIDPWAILIFSIFSPGFSLSSRLWRGWKWCGSEIGQLWRPLGIKSFYMVSISFYVFYNQVWILNFSTLVSHPSFVGAKSSHVCWALVGSPSFPRCCVLESTVLHQLIETQLQSTPN